MANDPTRSDFSDQLLDGIRDLLQRTLTGTGTQGQNRTPVDHDSLLERIKDILTSPLPGTERSDSQTSFPTPTANAPIPPATPLPDGRVQSPFDRKTADPRADDWMAVRQRQQQEREALRSRHEAEREALRAQHQRQREELGFGHWQDTDDANGDGDDFNPGQNRGLGRGRGRRFRNS